MILVHQPFLGTMKVRINIRMVNPRQAFKASTYMALLECDDPDHVWFGECMGRTRQYETWVEAATHGVSLAVKKQFGAYEITNFNLVAARVLGMP